MRYTFECAACGAQHDWIGSYTEKPDTIRCPCGQEALQLLCTNLVMKQSAPAMPSDKELCRSLFERSNARLRKNEHKIRARDREIVEAARNRVQAERSRPKTHGSNSAVERATLPARFTREYEMRNGGGSWNKLMQDPPALKKTLKEANLWLGS